MTINQKSAFHRTLRFGSCFLIGAAALTACGEGTNDVATVSGARPAPAAPAALYVSPEQADKTAQLAGRAERAAEEALARGATVSTSGYAAAEAAAKRALEATSAHPSADALERRAPKAPYVSPEQADKAAQLAVRAERTSAHGSADAAERWALSDGEG